MKLFETVCVDLRHAARGLRSRPIWTATVVLTLAVGIGACSAVFAVVNALLLNPLYYDGADRVVEIRMTKLLVSQPGVGMSPVPSVIQAWHRRARSFDAIEPIPSADVLVDIGNGLPALVRQVSIEPTFLAFANQRVVLGRGFNEGDVEFSAEPVILLGERFWRSRFSSDSSIIGSRVHMDGVAWTIVGVVSRDLHVPGEPPDGISVWRPYDTRTASIEEAITPVRTIGRLRKGVRDDVAQAEMDRVLREDPSLRSQGLRTALTPLWKLDRLHGSLQLLSAAVTLVLVLACGNVAHLLLARGISREREMQVRAALGATPMRLWQWLMAEAMLLVMASYALGVGLSLVLLALVVAVRPDAAAELDATRMNASVLLAGFAFSVATGIAFATLEFLNQPRWFVSRSGTRRPSRRNRDGAMWILIATEATAASLVIFATLSMLRTVNRLQDTDPGLRVNGLVALRLQLPPNKELPPASYLDALAARVSRIPGVLGVTFASQAPPDVGAIRINSAVEVEGAPSLGSTIPRLTYYRVAVNFFAVAGVRILEGTTFSDSSADGGQVLLSQTTARRLWPGRGAVGGRFRLDGRGNWNTVVGVVADVAAGGLAQASREPVMYVPTAEHRVPVLLIRTSGLPGISGRLRDAASAFDRRLPEPTVTAIAEAMSETVARPVFVMRILSAFADLCVLLTAMGVYGVLSFAVQQRRKQIAIRLAVGGSPFDIGKAVFRQALRPAFVGLLLGSLCTPVIARVLSASTQGGGEWDVVAMAGTCLVLVATALAAAAIPARRAMRTDPASILRTE